MSQEPTEAYLSRLDEIDAQINSLTKERQRLVFERIRQCGHPLIASRGDFRSKYHVCVDCGLRVDHAPGSRLNAPLVSFLDADMLSSTRRRISEQVRLSVVQAHALSFPKRFTRRYLEELLRDTPWTPEEVLEADHHTLAAWEKPADCYADTTFGSCDED